MMLFADIDWTAVITNCGLAIGGVLGVLGGWALKLRQSRQNHEIAQKKLEFELLKKQREDEKAEKEAEQERLDRKARREELLAEKKENKLVTGLEALVKKLTEAHDADRQEIHDLRDAIGLLSSQLELCKRGHDQQARVMRMICENLGIDFEAEVSKMFAKKPGSAVHQILDTKQLLQTIKKQAQQAEEAESDPPH